MSIPYNLRRLLVEDSIVKLVKRIYKSSKVKEKFEIYPEETNKCLNNAYADQILQDINPDQYQKAVDRCSDISENEFIKLILKNNFVRGKFILDEDSFPVLIVDKVLKNKFNLIVEWVRDRKYIIDSGLFSLNTLTGDAYFRDKFAPFRSGGGYCDLFKAFLTTNKSFLSFQEIYDIQQQRVIKSTEGEIKQEAKECIKHLKKKLKMRSGEGRLFRMYEGKGYVLLFDLIE